MKPRRIGRYVTAFVTEYPAGKRGPLDVRCRMAEERIGTACEYGRIAHNRPAAPTRVAVVTDLRRHRVRAIEYVPVCRRVDKDDGDLIAVRKLVEDHGSSHSDGASCATAWTTILEGEASLA